MLKSYCSSDLVPQYHQLLPSSNAIPTASFGQPTAAMSTFDAPRPCQRFASCALDCPDVDNESFDAAAVDALVRELSMDESLPDLDLRSLQCSIPSNTSLTSSESFTQHDPAFAAFSRQSSVDTAVPCTTPPSSTAQAGPAPWPVHGPAGFFPSPSASTHSSSGSLPSSPLSSIGSISSTGSGIDNVYDALGEMDSPLSPSSPALSELESPASCGSYSPLTSARSPHLPVPCPASAPSNTKNIKLPQRRGATQLWQFLLSLLESETPSTMVEWTNRAQLEFRLLDPEAVAAQWGQIKHRPCMNYDKLSRSLRYYYDKGIMQKVPGERYVYCFTCSPWLLKKALSGGSKRRRRRRSRAASAELTQTTLMPATSSPLQQVSSQSFTPTVAPMSYNACGSSYSLPSCRDFSVGPSHDSLPQLQRYAFQN